MIDVLIKDQPQLSVAGNQHPVQVAGIASAKNKYARPRTNWLGGLCAV
jgi:hypothetical protein